MNISNLSLETGDYFQLEGKFRRQTVCVVVSDDTIASNDVIRLSRWTRLNLQVKNGDLISISQCPDLENGERIQILPFEDTLKNVSSDVFHSHIVPFFNDAYRPLTTGDIFMIRGIASVVEFRTVLVEPGPSVIVGPHTKIQWQGVPLPRPAELSDLDLLCYDDVGGCSQALSFLRELVELPLRHPELCEASGVEAPQGILVQGPSGSGKTLIVRTLGNETGAHLVIVNGLDFVGMTIDEAEANLRSALANAEQNKPSIFFIDTIDAISPHHSKILQVLEDSRRQPSIVVMGATSRPSEVHALLHERLQWQVEIPVPDSAGRQQILSIHTRRMKLAGDVYLSKIADEAKGFVGRELKELCREAARCQVKEALRSGDPEASLEDFTASLVVTKDNFENAMRKLSQKNGSASAAPHPSVSLSNIGGYKAVIGEMLSVIGDGTKFKDMYSRFAHKPPRGMIVFGPPGCGKTQLVKAVAKRSNRSLTVVKGPELLSSDVGETEWKIRNVFHEAASKAPSVLLFDELESLGAKRGAVAGHMTPADRAVNELLTSIDGIVEDVFVVGTTNRPDTIDTALTRGGRLEHMVYLPVPDECSRLDIITKKFAGIPLNKNIPLAYLAQQTKGFTGADLYGMCRRTCKAAAEDAIARKKAAAANDETVYLVEREHVKQAMDTVRRTLSDYDINQYDLLAAQYLRTERTANFQFPADS